MRAKLDFPECTFADCLSKDVMTYTLCLVMFLCGLLFRSLGLWYYVLKWRVSTLVLFPSVVWGSMFNVAERVVTE